MLASFFSFSHFVVALSINCNNVLIVFKSGILKKANKILLNCFIQLAI